MYNKSLLAMTTSNQKSEKMDIEDEQCLNQQDYEQLYNYQRSRSQGLVVRRLISTNSEFQKQATVIVSVPTTILVDHSQNKSNLPSFQLFRKIKKEKKKNPSDYRKNICGYITKKIIREFTSSSYYQKVKQLCTQYRCDYNDAKAYYVSKIQHVTGPSHIPGLLIPEDKTQTRFKQAFRQFFEWFLKERYLRYLLLEGKMSDKKAYIQYKNNVLLSMLNRNNIQFPLKVQESPDQLKTKENAPEIFNSFPLICIPTVRRDFVPKIEENQNALKFNHQIFAPQAGTQVIKAGGTIKQQEQ